MTSIAEKYAQQYQPNGEVSLADLIQAAVDEARSVPEGYVMVPVEPTPEMIDTVLRYANGDDLSFYGADELRKEVKQDWALMLSAAPEGKK